CSSFSGESREQRCRRPERRVRPGYCRDASERAGNRDQIDAIPIEHGAAPVSRKTVTVEVDEVDVRTALCDALVDYSGSFVDQRIDAALDDFRIRDCA